MNDPIKLSKVKEETWKLAIHYLMNFKKGYESNIFTEKIGVAYIDNLMQNPEIRKFQWNAIAGQKFNILKVYLGHFLGSIFNYCHLKSIEFQEMQGSDLENNNSLKEYFVSQYEKLEAEIFLPDYFRYEILIPAFNILFKDFDSIKLDSNHIIRNIIEEEEPYGIKEFKNPPLFWSRRREEERWAKEAMASIEVIYDKKKRLRDEEPYSAMPYWPLDHNGKDEFDELVLSIPDFFMLYSDRHEFFPFSISHYYWIKLPAFSDFFALSKGYIHYSFPRPNAYLRLYDQNTRSYWLDAWNSHYVWFYNSFYSDERELDSKRIFHYGVNTVRTLNNIQYADLRVFILVSTFEGLLYKKSIGLELTGSEYKKSEPVIRIFKKISEVEKKRWTKFEDDLDSLEEFLKDAFTVRNNIAHPERIDDPKYQPEILYEGIHTDLYDGKLMSYIQLYFKEFLWFLLKLWVNNKYETNEEWLIYLEDIKRLILEKV